MKTFGGWEAFEPPLGRGGQGTVYKARSPQRSAAISNARHRVRDAIVRLGNAERISPKPDPEDELNGLISSIGELSRPDSLATELGALKQFDIPTLAGREAQAAVGRFEREIEALKSVQHPGILRLLDQNIVQRWFVTEYHPGGTLADDRSRYKGDALAALKAFLSIVEAVAELHQKGYVHRDIKSNNVFIAADGRLVLGDFGIVFFEDQDRTRLTEEYERVGTRDWMAPWAHTGVRVDEVRPTFDIFPLGKLLWVMISGQRILPPYRTHRSPGFKLEEIFPGRPGMEQINAILEKCVVTEETDCLQSAGPLRDMVAAAIEALEQNSGFREITLTSPDGLFRVRVTLSRFQLTATPLLLNEKREWVAQEDAAGLINSRWQLDPAGRQLYRVA